MRAASYTTRPIHGGMWHEVKRVIRPPGAEPVVKQTTCCCADPGATANQCRDKAGNKTRCRCWCHSRRT